MPGIIFFDLHKTAKLFLQENYRLFLGRVRDLPDGERYSLELNSEEVPFVSEELVTQILALEGSVDEVKSTRKNDVEIISGYATRRRRIVVSSISWLPLTDQGYLNALKNAPSPLRDGFHLLKIRGDESIDCLSGFIGKLVDATGADIEVGLRCDISAIEDSTQILDNVWLLRERFKETIKLRTIMIDGISCASHWHSLNQFASNGEFEFDLSIYAVSGIGVKTDACKAFTRQIGYRSLENDPRCPDVFEGAATPIRLPRTPYAFDIRAKFQRHVAGWFARLILFRTRLIDQINLYVFSRWDYFINRRNSAYVPVLNVIDPRPWVQTKFFEGVTEDNFLEHALPFDWPEAALVARLGRVLDGELQNFFRYSVNVTPSLSKYWQNYAVHNWAPPDWTHGVLLDISANSISHLIELVNAREDQNQWHAVDAERYLLDVASALNSKKSQELREFQLEAHAYQFGGGRKTLSADGIALTNWMDEKLGKLLEIGAGFGLTVELLHSRTPLYVALDLTLTQAKSCALMGAFSIAGDMHELPIADEVFDTVVADNTLEHAYDPTKLLLEIHRVLRKGGKLYAVLPPDGHSRWYSMPAHYWKLDELSLRYAASIAGFRVERLEYLRYEDIGMHGGYRASDGKTILVEMVAT